jgi:hypothetical protein
MSSKRPAPLGRAWPGVVAACVTGIVLSLGASCGRANERAPLMDDDGSAPVESGVGDATGSPPLSDVAVGGFGDVFADYHAGTDGGVFYPPHRTCASSTLEVGAVTSSVADLFRNATVDPSSGPVLVYPTSGTMLPPNMADLLFQWQATSGNAYWLHFYADDPGFPKLEVYTDGHNATCDQAATGGHCWESGEMDLMCTLGMAADRGLDAGIDIHLTVASLDTSQPAKKQVSPEYTLHVARTDITGAVYYWSTTSKGVRRAVFSTPLPADGGAAKPPVPLDYITNAVYPPTTEAASVRCAACHTLSRDGTKLAVSLYGDVLGVIDVVPTIPPPMTLGPASKGFGGPYIASSWSSFSPDAGSIVTASVGVMTVRDVASGQPIGGTGVIALPTNTAGSMPDWSPDSQHLVFASTPISSPNTSYGRHLYGSSIAMMTASGTGFADYQVVAQSTQTNCQPILEGGLGDPAYNEAGARETYANPAFSLDSKWLLFSRADCESEEDPTAELILAPAEPSAPQNHLTNANRQEGDHLIESSTNGMPVWGPTNDPKIRWIAFTSARNYGLVLGPTSQFNNSLTPPFPSYQVRQLWIAAVDLSKLQAGVTSVDPSYPAFRFSTQSLSENNHRPFWTVDTLPTLNNGPTNQ